MENFDFELLNNLMNLYFGLGIFLLILAVACLGIILGKLFTYLMEENDKQVKNNTRKQVKEILKEIKQNGEK